MAVLGLWASVQDECHDTLDAGFGEQCCGEGERPAAAGGGRTEKNRSSGWRWESLQANGLFQMVYM